MPDKSDWHMMCCEDVLRQLESDAQMGLSGAEAARRLAQYGPNQLVDKGGKNRWVILWEQFASTMVVILIVAALASVLLGDYKDAATILAIVLLNTVLGYLQEYRAERAMSALKRLAIPNVTVRRDGHVREISARELVPGDIVMLETGAIVAADCRLIETASLRVQEAVLTGESEPVEKAARQLAGGAERCERGMPGNLPLADRRNMAYMGTTVSYGRGEGLVTETGMSTELGSIATLIQQVNHEPTPLQRRLDGLGKKLALIALVIVAVVFALGLLRGEGLHIMFLTAVSMAVAAIPEGLPAVVTIALALGAQRMLKRHALIRKLPAVETLGSVTVICSDKTGTLTQNHMTVTVLDVAGNHLDISPDPGCDNTLSSTDSQAVLDTTCHPDMALLLAGAALCNDAKLHDLNQSEGPPQATGDPTEAALVVASAELGLWKDRLERALPRVAEVPFESDRKRMTTLHALPSHAGEMPAGLQKLLEYARGTASLAAPIPAGRALVEPGTQPCSPCSPCSPSPLIAFTKGAVDSLLEVCDSVWSDGRVEELSGQWRSRIVESNNRMANNGMRVLGVAFRLYDALPAAVGKTGAADAAYSLDGAVLRDLESGLVFTGMVGMVDPARPEAMAAVQTCKSAGIRLVMITGDHPLTALYVAGRLGLVDTESHQQSGGGSSPSMLTGQELDTLSNGELEHIVEHIAVYARVSPMHKLDIVRALQNRGHIVAMTGDGVNDAPALRKADIGIAMGINGTDVSKEAAEMVLVDDNFATIVAAVEEGRVIYDNIRKFVRYLMTTNSAEIWVMLLAPFLGMPLALLPMQILWINLVTDGLPALALAVEPPERDIMRRPPIDPKEIILGRGGLVRVLCIGLLMALVTLGAGYWYWQAGGDNWQTMLFCIITLSQMANVLAARSARDSIFSIGAFSNKPLIAAVGLTIGLQMLVVFLPAMQDLFGTLSLGIGDLCIAFALSTTVLWVEELWKLVARLRINTSTRSSM